jgi:hypothetical protein
MRRNLGAGAAQRFPPLGRVSVRHAVPSPAMNYSYIFRGDRPTGEWL